MDCEVLSLPRIDSVTIFSDSIAVITGRYFSKPFHIDHIVVLNLNTLRVMEWVALIRDRRDFQELLVVNEAQRELCLLIPGTGIVGGELYSIDVQEHAFRIRERQRGLSVHRIMSPTIVSATTSDDGFRQVHVQW
jgi:hypothetical protein